jgi:hypothetical protein
MRTGAVVRVAAGVVLLGYALVAFVGLGRALSPLLPALVGAYLLVRGLTGREVGDGGGS